MISPPQTTNETAFTDEEFDGIYPEGIERNFWHTCRNKFILTALSPQLKYMDVGSGRGIVTDYLYKHGIAVQGAELGDANPMPNSTVPIHYATDVTLLPLSLRLQIQALTFFDVIEHIETPVSFIEAILEAYPNVTELVFTVPARQEIWTNFDEFNRHFMRYSLSDMNLVVEELGFRVVTNRYFFSRCTGFYLPKPGFHVLTATNSNCPQGYFSCGTQAYRQTDVLGKYSFAHPLVRFVCSLHCPQIAWLGFSRCRSRNWRNACRRVVVRPQEKAARCWGN